MQLGRKPAALSKNTILRIGALRLGAQRRGADVAVNTLDFVASRPVLAGRHAGDHFQIGELGVRGGEVVAVIAVAAVRAVFAEVVHVAHFHVFDFVDTLFFVGFGAPVEPLAGAVAEDGLWGGRLRGWEWLGYYFWGGRFQCVGPGGGD